MAYDINEVFKALGLPPPGRKHHRRQRNITLSDEAWQGLEKLAVQNGFNHWRGGNVSAFVEAVGLQLFHLERKQPWEIESS